MTGQTVNRYKLRSTGSREPCTKVLSKAMVAALKRTPRVRRRPKLLLILWVIRVDKVYLGDLGYPIRYNDKIY